MKRENIVDEYFSNQPELGFISELASYSPRTIKFTQKSVKNSAKFCGVYLDKGEFLNDELLEISFNDFENFLSVNGINGKDYKVKLLTNKSLQKEEFKIIPLIDSCEIFVGEREGVRRALDKLEDLVLVNGGYLPLKEVSQKPIIKRRISRCFFAPINRPPKYGDELFDEKDYYPDGYLKKLMHCAINAIWIPTSFDDMVKTSYIPEFGQNSEIRVKKLNKVIEKCAKYGIEVFLFVLEPISLNNASIDKKHPNIIEKYPEVNGNVYHDKSTGEYGVAFCTFTEFGRNYCIEAVSNIFKNSPNLAGFISITQGERITACSNTYTDEENRWSNNCPHCSQYSQVDILTNTINIIKEGMRRAKPSAEFISWTYGHRYWEYSDIEDYVDKVPKDVILMQNFEDGAISKQLNKKRFIFDYWLSYDKYSKMFKITSDRAIKDDKQLYAKMQVCCSHELASVPYIPVPGIIYTKITDAKKLGVSGVMESWFFGNFPCIMSKAVEVLYSNKNFANKNEFLTYLAKTYYDSESAKYVVKAWNCFEKAYKNCPWNIMFSYYGPMHDGVVWKLQLLPKNYSLGRTWQLIDRSDGDRIGECLFKGHTINEVIELLTRLNCEWQKGIQFFEKTSAWKGEFNEQVSLIKALSILYKSCLNIMLFYKKRSDLGYLRGDSKKLLSELKELVYKEIQNSSDMIVLCEKDSRLGYHSEAEGYKFFPEKLKNRIEYLENLLKTEFTEVENRINKGKFPLEYFNGVDSDSKHYYLSENKFEKLSDGTSEFRIFDDEKYLYYELKGEKDTDFVIANEFELFYPDTSILIKHDGRIIVHNSSLNYQSVRGKLQQQTLRNWQTVKVYDDSHILVRVNKKKVGFIGYPFRTMVKTTKKASWCVDSNPVYTLGKPVLSPYDFGFVHDKK